MTQASTPELRQAVILAGGKATRMRPYTDERPKALIDIGGRTILEHQARWLVRGGVQHMVISCQYLADVLQSYVDSHDLGLSVDILAEDQPLGRGGALKYAARSLPFPDERWVGLNGDILTDCSLTVMNERHDSAMVTASIAVARLKSPYGIVEVGDNDIVSNFIEVAVLPHWVNAGIYLFEPEIVKLLPDKGDHEDSMFPQLARDGRLSAYRIEGYWRGIDTVKDIQTAAAEVRQLGWV